MVGVVGLASPALAQNGEPVLGGPKVRDAGPPGQTFDGKPGNDPRRYVRGEMPMPVYLNVLRKTLGPEAPEELRVTDAQRAEIEAAARSHGEAMRKFFDEHREEIGDWRPEAGGRKGEGPGPKGERRGGPRGEGGQGPGPGRGGRGRDEMGELPPPPPPGDEMNDMPRRGGPAMDEAARQRRQELMAQAPKATEAQAKIWAVLRPEQQEAMKQAMAKWADESAQQRQRGKLEERPGALAEQGARKEWMKDGKRDDRRMERGGPGGPRGEILRQFQEKLRDLPPEAREEITKKFREGTPEEKRAILEQFGIELPPAPPPRDL